MRRPRLLVASLVVLLASVALARELSWRAFDVKARLDASGALHVVETQTMVFDGDWNGGERTFRVLAGQGLAFEWIARVDPDGTRHRLSPGDLSGVDQYRFVSNNVLRWRSRLPSDPPFDHAERVYEISYALAGILVKQGDRYVLDHDFAFPDRQYPIEKFALTLSLDPAWKPPSPLPARYESGALRPGQGYVVKIELEHLGGGTPSFNRVPPAQTPASPLLRRALLAVFAVGIAFFFLALRRRGQVVGLFAPLTPPDRIDAAWLDKNLLSMSPEEAGGLWDEKIGPPEVAAILARLEGEKKVSSLPDGRKLTMRLLAPLESFRDYEHELLKALFFGNREATDTDAIKAHYKSTGFDPASKIKPGLQAKLAAHADFGDAIPPPSRWPTAILFLGGVALLLAAIFLGGQDPGSVVAIAITLVVLCAIAMGCAWTFRQRIEHGAATWLLILWLPLALLYFSWLGVRGGSRELVLYVVALMLVKLAAVRSVFDMAATREGPKRVARRKALASAREFFRRELSSPAPRLKDAWFPYVVAFGLTSEADRWFRAHGAAA
ncbi:MAG TPA: DUF2207 domain-containing protein, partial [Thermoanaerobaculia bacterium]|nr:DUF2207 domain-containing protein [Thermoanaerobaculia bacterium]